MSFWHLGRVCVCVGWGRGLCVLCLICHVGVFYVLWVCVCGGVMFDWPGSCLLALVDVMAIKLVVSFSANKVLGVTRWRCAGDVLINSLRALAA